MGRCLKTAHGGLLAQQECCNLEGERYISS